jgi:Zn-dependent protease with chaperone function
MIKLLKLFSFFLITLSVTLFIGCSTVSSKNFNKRITESQQAWRYSGAPFYGEQKLVADLSPQGQLQTMLNKIVFVSPLRGYSVPLVLVDGNNPAFTDGKSIFVNAAFAQAFWHDQSMLASVIAHEFGHILAHHNPEAGKDMRTVYSAISPFLGLVRFGGYANLALRESMTMGQRAYSRVQEKEADAIAIFLAYQAGYDPRGLVRFFDYIEKARKGQLGSLTLPITNYANPSSAISAVAVSVLRSSPLYKTHPSPSKRKADLETMIRYKNNLVHPLKKQKESSPILEVYKTLEARRPKTNL